MPRLLRPVPAFPVFCCPRPVARVLRPAPRARVFRLLHFVPPFPVFCSPRPVARVLRPASCTPCPRARARARARVRVHVFRVLRPAPHARVFRLPCSAPAPRTRTRTRGPAALRSVPVAPHPWPRTRVSCAPCPCPRLLRSADGSPRSAPYLPPHTSGRLLPASARCRDEKKIGRFPTGTSRFCMHCSGASYSRLRIISPPW